MDMIRYHIVFLTKTTENGNRGEIMDGTRTTFNRFGCDKKYRISKEETYRRMYSTENYTTRDLAESFSANGEIIKGTRL